MTTYEIRVDATTPKDAEDIARRRAREDGYDTLQVVKSHPLPMPFKDRWVVTLEVAKR